MWQHCVVSIWRTNKLVAVLLLVSSLLLVGSECWAQNAHIIMDQGLDRFNAKDYNGAMADYNEAISLDPRFGNAYTNRGLCLSKMGYNKRALADFNMALYLRPNDFNAHYFRGEALRQVGDLQGAIADYDWVLRASPNTYDPYLGRGYCYLRQGDANAAFNDLAKYVRAYPSNVSGYLYLGLANTATGENSDAIQDFNYVLRLDPKLADAYSGRAFAEACLGKWQEAVKDYKQSLSMGKNTSDLLLQLASAKFIGKQYASAADDLKKVMLKAGSKDKLGAYAGILGSISLRYVGTKPPADQMLTDARKALKSTEWPAPVIDYLEHKITADQLLAKATKDDQKTEANAYIGLDLLQAAEKDKARPFLAAAVKSRNKNFNEYALSKTALDTIPDRPQVTPAAALNCPD